MATNNNNIFILDDGTREVTFNNNYGEEICKIRIRSGDLSVLDRYNKLTDDFDEIIKPLESVKDLKTDGTSEFEQEWKIIKEVENEFIRRINEVFDMKDGGKFFENRHAFSTINGVFYVEKVIEALGNLVAEEIKHENELTQERIKKYTGDIEK